MKLSYLLLTSITLVLKTNEVCAAEYVAEPPEFHISRLETVVYFAQYHNYNYPVAPVPPAALGVAGAVAGGAAVGAATATEMGIAAVATTAATVSLAPAIVAGGAIAGVGVLGYVAAKSLGEWLTPDGYEGGVLLVETKDRISGNPAFCAHVLFRAAEGKSGRHYWHSVKGKVDIELLRGVDYFSATRNYPAPMASDEPNGVFTVNEPALNLHTVVGTPEQKRDNWIRDTSYGHVVLANPLSFRELYNRINGMRNLLPGSNEWQFPFYYTIAGFSSHWSKHDAINCFGFCLRLAQKLGVPVTSNTFLSEYLLTPKTVKSISKKTGKPILKKIIPQKSTSQNILERRRFLKELFAVGPQQIAGLVLSTVAPTATEVRKYWENINPSTEERKFASEFLANGGHHSDFVSIPQNRFM